MQSPNLPGSVRYVKNGNGGKWWKEAKAKGQVHLGWSTVPSDLLIEPNFEVIENILRKHHRKRGKPEGTATMDLNQLRDLLDNPSKHVWVTFEDGALWWCTVRNGAVPNPEGESDERGNFWLECDRGWSNLSLLGRQLNLQNLPGFVWRSAGFRATVCTPRDWEAILRVIQGESDPDAEDARRRREEYTQAVSKMVKKLRWQDLELLVDLILARSGWIRLSRRGGQLEGIDIEAEHPATDERAFVQIKSEAGQRELDEYIEEFRRQPHYSRMFFVVHSTRNEAELAVDPDLQAAVQVWDCEWLSKAVLRTGLGQWVEERLA